MGVKGGKGHAQAGGENDTLGRWAGKFCQPRGHLSAAGRKRGRSQGFNEAKPSRQCE